MEEPDTIAESDNPAPGRQKHILIVDDDRDMRDMLSDYLGNHFEVSTATDGRDAKWMVAHRLIDLAVVDLNLGREDGLQVVRDLSSQAIPVIIITGNRVDEADKVLGLEIGAVDYLTKPVPMREFLARIRSRLRRRESRKAVRGVSYCFAGFELHQRERSFRRTGADEIKLSIGEFNILSAFLRAPRQVLSREHLLNESRLRSEDVFDRSIDVLILRLRRKIEQNPAQPCLIKTIRNKGYVLDADVTEQDYLT
ncbi:response regulator [Rhizobium viscosum]|uniref:DNA-binding response OmpR family regulator n=1 Tax=Rhizobium viscosum TaxID=1673 RepID=A0ABR9IZR5_RHIVS|nr:response regulator [Rhizobium viscosum]MBE1508626.1 DNA-binding response OmpR family regulator [Rhizobium viscosum]